MHTFFKYLPLVILSTFISIGVSYSATLKGKVIDKRSGEPLAGAIVTLDSNKFVAEAGLDGSYTIPGLQKGSYTMRVMYSSYVFMPVVVKVDDENKVLVQDVMAEQDMHFLGEVEITAKAKNGSDEQARNIEKNSTELMNILSAKTIELLPDNTVADVLQRISGVTVQRNANGEPRYADIRGMDKRYNYTTIDGIKIPSPDDKMRYVPMDMFPNELLDRVEVIKTLTPSMEADAIGGVMNLKMKDAPDHLVVYATAATGMSENAMNQGFESFVKGGQQEKDPYQLNGPAYNATPSDFNKDIIRNKTAPTMPNGLYSLTLGNRFLKSKKLGAIISGSYQNTYKITNTVFFNPASQPGVNNLPEFDDIEIRKYSTREQRGGVHAKVDYEFNKKNSISLYGIFIQSNMYEDRYITDTTVSGQNRPGPGLGNVGFKDRISTRKDNTTSGVLEGNHLLLPNLKLQWKGAISKATRDIPDMTTLSTGLNITQDTSGNKVASPNLLKSIGHTWENNKDHDEQGIVNLTYTPSIFGKEVEFMAGGLYRHKERTSYYNDYTVNNIGNIPASSLPTIDNSSLTVSDPLGTWEGQPLNSNVTEDITAGYLQFKFHLLDNKLQVLGGARIENTQLWYATPTVDAHYAVGTTASYYYTDVLPSLHLKYALEDNQALRLSYFKSIARPGYFEMVPFNYAGDYYSELGNPYLDRSHADNVDMRYEWFPKGIDQVLVGAFYKNIQDPIELNVNRNGKISASSLQPQNEPNPAVNYGAEMVLTKYFHYWGISANYTYTHSAITTPKLYNQQTVGSSYKVDSVSETRPLQGQAAHVANIALIYKNPKLGLDAHFSWQYTGKNIAFVSAYQGLDYWNRAASYFALSLEKKVYKHVAIYAKINNLFNFHPVVELEQSSKQFTYPNGLFLPYQIDPNNIIVQRDSYGRSYLIGIRFKMD